MEIIHIILGKANPDRLNGVNKVVYNLATQQAKAGKNVAVWGITADLRHNYPSRNFATRLFKASRIPFFVDAALKQSILQHKEAVFHLHGGWIPVFSSLARFFAQNAVRYVLTPHGAYNSIAMQRSLIKKRVYHRLFESALLRHAYRIHAIGASEVEGLTAVFPTASPKLLPYGFDFKPRRGAFSKNSDFTVGFVGRLDVYTKGLDLLLEAFKIFQKTHPNSKLWIIGEGDGMPFLQEFKEKNHLSNIVFWGKRFGDEKDDLMSKMHVFGHPSRNEGLPSAVLEAAALGIPTIVTKATNLYEYVIRFGAGIGIEDNSLAALVAALESMYKRYETGDFSDYSDGASKMLSSVFDWSDLVHRYDELYE